MVEHVLALPLFLLVLFASFELLRVSYHALTLQYACAGFMRDATITPIAPAAIRGEINRRLARFSVSLEPGDVVTYCPVDLYKTPACPEDSELQLGGAERELMVLTAAKQSRVLLIPGFSQLSFTVQAIVLGRNEPE